MKFFTKLLLLVFFAGLLQAATPLIDGVFDGESVWGSPVATADGLAGWSSVNIDKLYVTYDENYAYFAALFYSGGEPAPWMHAAFEVNVKAGGGPSDPWAAAITYAYTPDDQKPDYVLTGRLGDDANWAEIRDWNGSDWGGGGTNVFGTDMSWTVDLNCIEGRILKTSLNSNVADVQFHIGGNNYDEHGTFDACPDDEVATGWNDPTSLDNYALDVPIDVGAALAGQKIRPADFRLMQNYPNPFGEGRSLSIKGPLSWRSNPKTVISWSLAVKADVELLVYDVLGRKVLAASYGAQTAGLHSVDFDGSDLSGGVYFYRIRAGKRLSAMRKMVLLR